MTQELTIIIFKYCWGLLLIIAVAAQFVFGGKLKKKAGLMTNLIVATPYLIVFGWFSVREHFGTYQGHLMTQLAGLILIILGICGYTVSILFLRYNWAVSAAIKERHSLVNNGPYKYVRHPMYFFMILVILGSGLLISNYLIILYTPIICIIYYWRAKKEEELLKNEIPGYDTYVSKTKMLLPSIFLNKGDRQ